MSESKEGGWFALGALLGASIGAAIGLLYAPRPGLETRRSLTEKSEELRERAKQAGSELVEQAQPSEGAEASGDAVTTAGAAPAAPSEDPDPVGDN